MTQRSYGLFDVVSVTLIVLLTLATGYLHYFVGGIMLTLNALGYLGLAVLVVGAASVYRRALPLVLLALAAYAAVTIGGWLVMGPYYDVAYLAKAIEIGLIAIIGFTLWRSRDDFRAALVWVRSLLPR